MRPERLVMQAFGPYAGRVEIDFAPFAEAGVFLVHGPTGAGKTSVLDAICFALYGTASGSGRDSALLRSHHAALDVPTEVRLDFALDGERYRVIRSPEQPRPRKRGKGLTTARAEAALYRLSAAPPATPGTGEDDGDLLVSGHREVREEVTRLLGFDEHQFRQVVMLPQGEFRRFIEADTATRQEIMRRLFGTEACRQLEEALRQRAADVSGRLDSLRQQVDDILGRHRAASIGDLEIRKAALKEALKNGMAFRGALEKKRFLLARVVEKTRAFHDAAARKASTERALKMAETAQKTAENAQKTAENALAELQAKAAERELKERRLQEAKALRERLDRLHALEAELAGFSRDLEGMERQQAQILQKQEAQETALATARAAQTAVLEQKSRLVDLKARHDHLQQARRHLNTLNAAMTAHAEAATALKTAETRLVRCKETLNARRQALADLQARWRRASAALLARSLKPGAPCPVCGSRDHPAPAHDDAALPGEVEEARLTEALEAAEQALEKARRERERAAADLAARAEALRQAGESLAEALRQAGMTIPPWLAAEGTARLRAGDIQPLDQALQVRLEEAQIALAAAERERDEKAAMAARIPDLETALKRLEEQRETLQGRMAELRARQANVEGRLEALQQDLPAERPDLAALDEEIRALKSWIEAHEEALETAQQERETRAQALARAKGQVQSARAALEEAKARHNEAHAALTAALEQALDAPLPADDPTVPPESQAGETDWPQRRRQVHEALAAARAALERGERPDQAMLERARQALDAALADVHRRLGGLGERIKALQTDLAAIEKAEVERKTLEERAGLLHHLATLAAGRQAPKVSFETFVLARLFEDVLDAASLRLLRMSRGRYRFERVDGSGEIPQDRRRRTGLDMVVRDAHTGTLRPVKSLSGGESFLAALALALGLADVARRHAGGRHLETLFIDEGFGSLDPEALDLAMNALADLQQDGRLVGIISHVAELKERIPMRLVVTPTPRGSHLHLEA